MSDTKISIVIPVHNGGTDLNKCLQAIADSSWENLECIVVDDASTDGMTEPAAEAAGARVIRMERQSGPSVARNRGVEQASGEIVFFVDADVVVHQDTFAKGVGVFQSQPEIAAVFGSYDDAPAHETFVSKYRNLYHHWIHQTAQTEATTFWTGCGAIRRDIFLELGGLSESIGRPSIEDIELGSRLYASGRKIRLVKDMQCQHLKHWTLRNVIVTDIFHRGIPWMTLLLANRDMPNDLNVNYKARLATMLAALLALIFVVFPLTGHAMALLPTAVFLAATASCSLLALKSGDGKLIPGILVLAPTLSSFAAGPGVLSLLPLAMVLVIAWTQLGFYRLAIRKHNLAFAFAVIPMQVVFFLCCAIAAAMGIMIHHWRRLRAPAAR